MEIQVINYVHVDSWDKAVRNLYGKPYSLQQQDGCKQRGIVWVTVPVVNAEDYESTALDSTEDEMGVSFSAWLNENVNSYDSMFWERNFYPSTEALANDMNIKGELPDGNYLIEIDW